MPRRGWKPVIRLSGTASVNYTCESNGTVTGGLMTFGSSTGDYDTNWSLSPEGLGVLDLFTVGQNRTRASYVGTIYVDPEAQAAFPELAGPENLA